MGKITTAAVDISWTGPGSDLADIASRSALDGSTVVGTQPTAEIVVGISGVRQNAAAAVAADGRLTAFCEQERLTRVRRSPLSAGQLPEEALDLVLHLAGTSRGRIAVYATGEADAVLPAGLPARRFDHHLAHAGAAYLTSPFDDAAILVCDQHSSPQVTVWYGRDGSLKNAEWSWPGAGFAALYSECAALFGLEPGQEHRLEALARLDRGDQPAPAIEGCFSCRDGHLQVAHDWQARVTRCIQADGPAWSLAAGATVAAAFQRELGKHLLAFLGDVRRTSGLAHICLGGGFFYNTYFNALVCTSGLFEGTFVAPNPGNPGLAAGAALIVGRAAHPIPAEEVSPFLGPGYDLEQIKATLDNCKLSYECLSDGEIIDTVVEALSRGRLVGWFQGRAEWGHRALGNRSILANPLSPFALDNLNLYLKKRNRHRAYGLSVSEEDVDRFFDGPARSCWMEYDYRLRRDGPFVNVLPAGARTLRVQTVGRDADRFWHLHKAFEKATGVPVLINTSFNGFSEPIVCSPRDAIRVFFGTGLDLLVLGRFLIRK